MLQRRQGYWILSKVSIEIRTIVTLASVGLSHNDLNILVGLQWEMLYWTPSECNHRNRTLVTVAASILYRDSLYGKLYLIAVFICYVHIWTKCDPNTPCIVIRMATNYILNANPRNMCHNTSNMGIACRRYLYVITLYTCHVTYKYLLYAMPIFDVW